MVGRDFRTDKSYAARVIDLKARAFKLQHDREARQIDRVLDDIQESIEDLKADLGLDEPTITDQDEDGTQHAEAGTQHEAGYDDRDGAGGSPGGDDLQAARKRRNPPAGGRRRTR